MARPGLATGGRARAWRTAGLLLLGAIALFGPVSPGWGQVSGVRLVQMGWEPEEGPVSFHVGRVEITLTGGGVRLLPYRTHFTPQVVDGRVFILPTKEGELTAIVVYHAATDRPEVFPRPPDLHPYFGCPSFSPDGRRIAYYVVPGSARGRARVRSWPEWRLLWESPRFRLTATDVPPDQPVWQGNETVSFDPGFFDPPRRLVFKLSD